MKKQPFNQKVHCGFKVEAELSKFYWNENDIHNLIRVFQLPGAKVSYFFFPGKVCGLLTNSIFSICVFFFFRKSGKKKKHCFFFFPWKSLQGTNSRKKKSHFENDWRLCTQATQVYFLKIQNDLERQCVQLMTCSDERKWYFYDKKFWGPRLTSLNFVRKLIGTIKLGGIIATRRVAFRYQFVQKVCLSLITFGDFLAPPRGWFHLSWHRKHVRGAAKKIVMTVDFKGFSFWNF